MDNNSKEKNLLYPETLPNLKTKWCKTCSASSAKLLLKKWMILTVLLSNSWLVNYKQPKKNNIGKVLCISWAVEICYYNQRSSKTCIRTSTACSHLKHSNNIPWIWGFSFERHWKSNSSCLMQNHRAWSGPSGEREEASFRYTIYSKHCTLSFTPYSNEHWTIL